MESGNRKAVTTIAIAMIVVPTVTILLRILSIIVVRKRKFGWDDYLAIAGLPFIVAIAGLSLGVASVIPKQGLLLGPPANMPNISPDDIPAAIKIKIQHGIPESMEHMVIAIQFLYLFGLSLPRFSLLCLYYRLFGKTKKWFANAIYITSALCALWLFVHVIVGSVKCIPLRAQFSFGPFAYGHCINGFAYLVSLLASSIFIDLILLILPMPIIFSIQATWTKRITVALIFACGGTVIIFTTGRLILTVIGGILATNKAFIEGGPIAAFIQLEAAMSLISISLPSIIALIRHIYSNNIKTLISSTTSTTGSKSGNSRIRLVNYRRFDDHSDQEKSKFTHSEHDVSPSYETPTQTSWSSIDKDDVENGALSVTPYRIMVKQEFHVRSDDPMI